MSVEVTESFFLIADAQQRFQLLRIQSEWSECE